MTRDLVAEFCAHYHAYNNISPQRRVMQLRVLREFVDHAGDVEVAGPDEITAYLASLVGTLEPVTIGQRLNAVRPFFTWLWHQKVIDAERLMEVREVKPPRGAKKKYKPRPYTRKEIQQFWRDLDDAYPWCACRTCKPGVRIDHGEMYLRRWRSGSSQYKRTRAYFVRAQVEAIVAFALMGGLRREEIFSLQLEDMHPDNHYIVVRGAAKNEAGEYEDRAVPWGAGQSMKLIVGRWLDLRAELAPDHDRPWLSLWHGAAKARPLRFCRFGELLGKVGPGYELHRLRHTFATESLRAGMPVERLSKILGHARLQQTLAYAELLEGDLVKAAERVEADFSRAIAPRPPLEVIAGEAA